MEALPHPAIVGLDVSCDSLDIHCLTDGLNLRLTYIGNGHAQLDQIACDRRAVACFEATGGHEWLLRAHLDDAGMRRNPLDRFGAASGALGRCRGSNAVVPSCAGLDLRGQPRSPRQTDRLDAG